MTTRAMTTLLDIRDLSFHYADRDGPVRAVDRVSFSLASGGSALGLVGESGSGKSSLALAIMRMLPANVARYDGEIWLDGQELLGMADERFRQQIRCVAGPGGPRRAERFNPVVGWGSRSLNRWSWAAPPVNGRPAPALWSYWPMWGCRRMFMPAIRMS